MLTPAEPDLAGLDLSGGDGGPICPDTSDLGSYFERERLWPDLFGLPVGNSGRNYYR